MQIRIQQFRSMWIRIQVRTRIQIQIQGFNKFTAENYYFFDQKLQFTYLWTSIKDSKLQVKPQALERQHPALQNMKSLHFFYY
jgi:hypothetical protein